MKDSIKILSFFSGAGFLDLGFEDSGFEIVLYNEVFKPFIEAYEYSRKKLGIRTPKFGAFNGDINDLNSERSSLIYEVMTKLRDDKSIVGFIGGPPCPDFSVAGKNKGRDGSNGVLSSVYVDLICKHQPDFFLFENVKGLWRTKKHREYYDELKGRLIESGYLVDDNLINSIDYGVPQVRERIILIGFKKGILSNSFIDDTSDMKFMFPWEVGKKFSFDELDRIEWPNATNFSIDNETECPRNVPRELTVQHWFDKNEVLSHPNSVDHFIPRAGIKRMLEILEGDDSRKSYKRLHRWRYSPTAAYGNNEVHLHPYKARRLSVSEALAIQSLPKEFELPASMTLTDKFKTVGNGVPYLVGKALAEGIRKIVEESL